MSKIIYLTPFFSPRPWGGQSLSKYGFQLPKNTLIGEAWVISGMPDRSSKIVETNTTLQQFYQLNKDSLSNTKSNVADEYPLLAKIISAEDDLSIQVHPDNDYAYHNEKGSLGKAECWYVMECPPKAEIIYGHAAQTKAEFKQLIEAQNWSQLLKKVPIQKGSFVKVPAGKIHAITKGVIVYELQQASDITYRLYDYDRPGLDGQPRTLHTAQSIAVTTIPDSNLRIKHINQGMLWDSAAFTIYLLNCSNRNQVDVTATNYVQITVLEGSGQFDNHFLTKGQSAVVYNLPDYVQVSGKIKALISYKK